jgi:phospholipid-transporting ATPase
VVIIKCKSEDEGFAYVETKSLDGESNLKVKKQHPDYSEHYKDADQDSRVYRNFSGIITLDAPNNDLYKSDFTFDYKHLKGNETKVVQGSIDNICLRGTVLRNSDYVVGCVLYTGHETKLQMNMQAAEYKESKMMKSTNKKIIIIFTFQLCIATLAAIIRLSLYSTASCMYYLGNECVDGEVLVTEDTSSAAYVFFTAFGTWILMFTNFVPISLLLTLEMVKLWQAQFIETEYMLHNTEIKPRAQSSNLNEELGQIDFIFSDKTGTLTRNEMAFKKFATCEASYNSFEDPTSEQPVAPDQAKLLHSEIQVAEESLQHLEDVINNPKKHSVEYAAVEKLMQHMVLCHDVIIDKTSMQYNASSPDELALVEGAKKLKFTFKSRDKDNVIKVEMPSGKEGLYQIVNVLEFNSDRKRMSVIVQDE